MKVFVTGAAGFIGSHVCLELLRSGTEVIGVDNFNSHLYPSECKRQNIARIREVSEFTFLEADLIRDDVSDLISWADVVIHEAAMPGLAKSWSNFESYNAANLLVTQKILTAIAGSTNTHLIHASTSSVYGRRAIGNESTATKPYSPYGVTKLAAENMIFAYRKNYGLNASILRYFSVYGPHQRPDMAYSKFCSAMINGQEIKVTGDGSQSRSNTYIDDIVHATVLAAQARIDGLIANVCGSENIKLLDAVDLLAEYLGVQPKIEFIESTAGDQFATNGDSGRVRAELGWTPRVSMEDGLRQQAQAALRSQNN